MAREQSSSIRACIHILWIYILVFFPVIMISIFYIRIVLRIRTNRSKLNMRPISKRNDRRKATFLVLLIIGIYIVAYTPFWMFQIVLLTTYIMNKNNLNQQSNHHISAHLSSLFQLLVYLNSTLNPFVYAFISEIFRTSFKEAIKCHKNLILFRNLFNDLSLYIGMNKSKTKKNSNKNRNDIRLNHLDLKQNKLKNEHKEVFL